MENLNTKLIQIYHDMIVGCDLCAGAGRGFEEGLERGWKGLGRLGGVGKDRLFIGKGGGFFDQRSVSSYRIPSPSPP